MTMRRIYNRKDKSYIEKFLKTCDVEDLLWVADFLWSEDFFITLRNNILYELEQMTNEELKELADYIRIELKKEKKASVMKKGDKEDIAYENAVSTIWDEMFSVLEELAERYNGVLEEESSHPSEWRVYDRYGDTIAMAYEDEEGFFVWDGIRKEYPYQLYKVNMKYNPEKGCFEVKYYKDGEYLTDCK